MCGRRGLEGDSDDQLFELLLTGSFRTHYDKIVAPIRGEGPTQAHSGEGVGGVISVCEGTACVFSVTYVKVQVCGVRVCVRCGWCEGVYLCSLSSPQVRMVLVKLVSRLIKT